MPTLLFTNMGLVKGIQFDSWRRVGGAMQAIKVYNMREVDELVFLDISATKENRSPDFEMIDSLADECFMPLTVGGGIRSVDDVRKLLKVGADKVSINTAAVENIQLVRDIAQKFGSQCVVVSIDVRRVDGDNNWRVYTHAGKKATNLDPIKFAQDAERMGAGEILLTSIDQDGTMNNYDIGLIKKITAAVNIPVIASGGAGNYEHMAEALMNGKASAVAAASIFHFTEQTPLAAKQYLKQKGINVRL